jgi:AraC family transcriptional regulator of adaptative response / DNA-3-methyladenine glycosylase II
MKLNHEQCYTAIQSRDSRFDGLFFTGVKTTGIFCRPVCPARTPLSENVTFFGSAAEAANAGFRPCLRCRPECAPESPEWNWSSSVVARAVRLIADGALEEMKLDDLAHQLHLSGRQLRRCFVQELGVPPVKVAQTHRLLFAKKLITETALPMTEIAFTAGYASIRRFNDAFKETYGRSPTALRQEGVEELSFHTSTADAQSNYLELKLAYRPPYSWPQILATQEKLVLPGVEEVVNDVYRRALCFGQQSGVIEVSKSPSTDHLLLRVPHSLTQHLRTICAHIKRMFDLRADPAAIDQHLRSDANLVSLLNAHPGIRIASAWDAREMAIQLLLNDLMGEAAVSDFLWQTVQQHGEKISEGEHLRASPRRGCFVYALPSTNLPKEEPWSMRTFVKHEPHPAADIDTTVAELCARGINRNVAHQIALYGMGEPDACPLLDAFPTMQTDSWRPWRGYASNLLSIDV